MAQIQLQATPNDFAETRESLHRVAEQIVSPARAAATGKAFSLVALPGGFGTPALPGQDRVRVDGLDLVVEGSDGGEQRVRLTSLAESARAVGLPADGLSDEPLTLNLAAAEVLAAAYTFGDGVLRALYGEAETSASATMPELWPEHFDVAIEHGDAATGARATYGLSPGDADHAEPYVYVAPWSPPADLRIWQAVGFTGAELSWSDLVTSDDPSAVALQFFREHREALSAS